MIASILTTIFFALSAVFGKRTADIFGSLTGNFLRLAVAAAALGLITLAVDPGSFATPTFLWFLLSGIIGFGFGDVGLFLAYARLGARLTMLIALCLAPIFSGLGEFLWLGTRITPQEGLAALVILVGVGLALRPRSGHPHTRAVFVSGIFFAVIAGFGQGVGAVISRQAETLSGQLDLEIGGISAAFQRVIGGLVIAFLAHLAFRRQAGPSERSPSRPMRGLPWLMGAALFGPVIGVSCFQWALKETPGAIVLVVVATTPIVLIPLTWLIEKDRPTWNSLAGAAIAVAGVAWICLLR